MGEGGRKKEKVPDTPRAKHTRIGARCGRSMGWLGEGRGSMWHISGVQARLHSSLLLEVQRRGDSEGVMHVTSS